MEEVLSIDSNSNFSSILDAPDHLEREYVPLSDVFQAHGANLPKTGSPESNSDAMIRALKALQDKIRTLELERSAAADKFRYLAEETQRQGRVAERATQVETPLLTTSSHSSPPTYMYSPTPSQDQEDLKGRLESIDARFTLQAKELEYMHERLQQAETDRHQAHTRNTLLEQQQRELREQQCRLQEMTPPPPFSYVQPDICSMKRETEEKLRKLERGHVKLSAVHSVTESKIKDLENHLMEERWQRRAIQDKTAQLQSATEVNRVLLEKSKPEEQKRIPVRRRKKAQHRVHPCTCGAKGGVDSLCRCRPTPGVHYRMNLRDVPFVVGTSTGPSHSVGANYQGVLSRMKAHSPLLCGAVAACRGGRKGPAGRKLPPSVSQAELRSLLAGLEEEFGHLTFEHQELARRLHKHTDPLRPQATAELEKQLEYLIDHMESKAEQIRIVKKQLQDRKRRPRMKSHCHPIAASLYVPRNGEVEVRTTVKAKRGSQKTSAETPSLEFLKKMKSLQNTLQQDDLSWD